MVVSPLNGITPGACRFSRPEQIRLFLVFLVVSDDFLNDEIQDSLGKVGVQIRRFRQVF